MQRTGQEPMTLCAMRCAQVKDVKEHYILKVRPSTCAQQAAEMGAKGRIGQPAAWVTAGAYKPLPET